MEDNRILRSKDIVAIFVDSLGVLCVPSTNEPIPESEENISQLRISPSVELKDMDYTRCMFRIETDLGQVSYYGYRIFCRYNLTVDCRKMKLSLDPL